jgi:hypothetical protein
MSVPESITARRIFLCYARSDALLIAETVRTALDAAGFEALGDWVLRAGQDWAQVLNDMLSRADGAVIVVTPDALESQALIREARFLYERAQKERDFPIIPLLGAGMSVTDLPRSPLGWLADFQVASGPGTRAQVDDAVASLSRDFEYVATSSQSAAESSSVPVESAAPASSSGLPELPAMSQSTRNVLEMALRLAGDGRVIDASVVFVCVMRYARKAPMPGVSGALLTALANRRPGAEDLMDRLDTALPTPDHIPGYSQLPLTLPLLAAVPPLSGLLALAGDCAQRIAGHREIHLRHLVAATVLADDPPLRQELLAALDVTAGELRQMAREAAREETTGESQEAWEALLPAVPLRLLGGIDTDRVDPNKGIPLSEDDLGFGVWASMFAHIIAGDNTPMPLSIGIFGAWGAGKSYFMGLLRAEIDRFAASRRPGYLSLVAQISFNAWHYADANLWASLGDEIFRQLAGPSAKGKDRRQHLREKLAEGQAERKELQARTAQAKNETARLEVELREATARRQTRAVDLLKAARESTELKKQLNQVWRRLGVTDQAEQAEMLAGEIGGISQDARALRGLLGQRRTWVMVAICLIALLVTVAGICIPASWGARLRDDGAASTLALVLTFGVTLLGRVKNGLSRLSAIATDLSQGAAAAADNRTEVQDKLTELKQAEAAEKVTTAQLEQVTARVGELARELADLMPGQRLYTFLAERSASGAYTSQLGLVSTIRKDFENLVELLDDWRKRGDHEHGRDGIDRIVLYIDDLDRCGPRQVAEVLQAVHLLLALDLFVVVVGVDPRWLTRSLRHQFPSTLDIMPGHDTQDHDLAEVTPADYLEKIFNIPFVLPEIPKDGLGQLMRRLAYVPEDRLDEASGTAGDVPAVTGTAPQAARQTAPPVEAHSEIARASSETAEEDTRPLSKDELDFLAGLEPFIGTPRDAKRMFNLYRMLRSTRDLSVASAFLGDRRQPGEYQAVAMLLAMLTADAHLLHYVLDALTCRPSQDRWHDFVDDLKPGRIEDRWENRIIGRIPDREVRGWQRLADEAASTRAQISLPDLSVFQRWAPSIRRFSYMLSPLNDPEG